MNPRYSTPEFIATVSKNLPGPEQSGPKSEEAKKRVRFNALRHGLACNSVLPCKGDQCYYAPLCPLLDQVEVLPPICAIELSEYERMTAAFGGEAYAANDEYILLHLRYERLLKCRAMDPEIVYQDRFEYHQSRLLARLLEHQAAHRSAEEQGQ